MPLAYGGGIRSLEDVAAGLHIGVEKVVIGSRAVEEPEFVRRVADPHGSSTVVVALTLRVAASAATSSVHTVGRAARVSIPSGSPSSSTAWGSASCCSPRSIAMGRWTATTSSPSSASPPR